MTLGKRIVRELQMRSCSCGASLIRVTVDVQYELYETPMPSTQQTIMPYVTCPKCYGALDRTDLMPFDRSAGGL